DGSHSYISAFSAGCCHVPSPWLTGRHTIRFALLSASFQEYIQNEEGGPARSGLSCWTTLLLFAVGLPVKDSNFFSSDVFATTKIDLEHVTKTLDVDSQSIVSVKKEKKTLVPKKEKAKQRRERWLQKIETLTVARQKVKAQVKRRATPVVGDMQPLVDALPELSELTTVRKPRAPRNQPRGVVKKKPEPTNYSKMRPAQKRKITEDEVSRMQELIKNPSFKANPLAAVRQHLLKRMREEQEENLS
uniref:SLX9 ribosome biosis factor n=1 Tax=Leptobrachium leishanense TaxID=445787 RepID=A0A8C5M9Q3_9ANUR